MDSRRFFILALGTYITLVFLESATCRSHGLKYHHHHYQSHLHNSNRNHHQNHPHSLDYNSGETANAIPKHGKSTPTSWRPSASDDDYEDEDDGGRHAYLMLPSSKKSSSERITEDQTLTQAFEKHMKPGTPNIHDVYAYQLPSDLWFIVRYSKNEDGQVEKYMNVVDSFTNYLEKLEDKDVRTVSVNVKGTETVFRLTPKRKPDNN